MVAVILCQFNKHKLLSGSLAVHMGDSCAHSFVATMTSLSKLAAHNANRTPTPSTLQRRGSRARIKHRGHRGTGCSTRRHCTAPGWDPYCLEESRGQFVVSCVASSTSLR